MLWNVTTTIAVDSALCNYSGGWQLQAVSNPFGSQVAFANQLGDQLQVNLPRKRADAVIRDYLFDDYLARRKHDLGDLPGFGGYCTWNLLRLS